MSTTGTTRYWRRHDRCRPAMSLIEVMVVVALSSAMLAVVVSLLVSLQQWDRRLRSSAIHSEQRLRLAERVRVDIRQASEVSLESPQQLRITMPEAGTIRYELGPEGCRRTLSADGNGTPRIETFSVGTGSSWQLDQGPPGRRPLMIVLLQESMAVREAPPPLSLLVYAALGAEPAAIESRATDE